MTIAWKRTAQAYPCTACGAHPGQPCRTTSNQPAFTPHTVRTSLASAHNWQDPDVEPQDLHSRV